VLEETSCLDNLAQIRTGSLKNSLDIFAGLMSLSLNIRDLDISRSRIDWNLSGRIDDISDHHSL